MRHTLRRYTPLNVDFVELEPGETYTFNGQNAGSSFGVFALGGDRTGDEVTEVTDPEEYAVTHLSAGAVPGRKFNYIGHWVPNDTDNGWANDGLGHEATTITAGEQGARWVCLTKNATGDREVAHLRIDGEEVIPAGWGFVVVRGTFQFEGKTAEQFAYVRPREADINVTGAGDLLLVR